MTESQRMYAKPGGDWALRDLQGERFGSWNLKGNYYLLFFGHSLSPETSPMTVYKMTKAIRNI